MQKSNKNFSIKIWRIWHRKINIRQKRFATASAIAASAILQLVQSRSHRVDNIPQYHQLLIIMYKLSKKQNKQQDSQKISEHIHMLEKLLTIKFRAGKGKFRNRRYRSRRGSLIVYNGINVPLLTAVRNIPGVENLHVSRLNVLQLAPEGHLGRFIIWTDDAFNALDNIFGTRRRAGVQKSGYVLPQNQVTNPDLAKVINSNQIQSAIRGQTSNFGIHTIQKKIHQLIKQLQMI